jgi:Rne/Rng family ribonuclease
VTDDTTTTTTPDPDDTETTATRTRSRSRRAPRAAAPETGAGGEQPSDEAAAPDDSGEPAGAASTQAPARRTRTRRKADAQDAAPEGAGDRAAPADADADAETADPDPAAETGDADAETEGSDDGPTAATTRTRRKTSRTSRTGAKAAGSKKSAEAEAEADGAEEADTETAVEADDDGDADGSDGSAEQGKADDGEEVIRRRRRRRGGRRGGRGRGRSGAQGATQDGGEEQDSEDGAEESATRTRTARPSDKKDAKKGDEDSKAENKDEDEDDSSSASSGGAATGGSTRLQARNRGRSSGRGRGRGKGGRKPLGGVSDETRRAITEGPPRRMLVTVGEQRTQIAVLEERTLVEHYVTRKEDVSYVGNIYLGRVQNVLPGMEAAFVDIGKGRNGVLYAGEVNYDEADLDDELPRIEDHLKPGQTVLVQVTKDPMGTKGARLTQNLSIAGRYCVLAPGDGMLGISRKLTDEERDRLRKVLKSIKPEGFGLIVRTAAEGATKEQLEADVSRLTRIWDQVQARSKEVKALDPVYEEPHLVMRVIRDVFGSEFSDLIVDTEELAEQVRDYLSDVSPEMMEKVSVHAGDEKIFDAYEVTNQVRRALEKKVWLKSGGYLIVEKTEAMWVIDVNTGKFVGKDNLEETVLKNNLEAADEIARQLRLRDMGGIIVIDFVDMLVPANRDEVLKRFKRELARDKTKSRVMDISKLGLVQMTRKNVSQGLTETFTTTCDTCEGRGAKILDEAFS